MARSRTRKQSNAPSNPLLTDGGTSERAIEQNDHLTPCTARIKPYNTAWAHAREIHDWVGDIEQDLSTMQWMAAGGLGSASREEVITSIDAQIGNLEALREEVEELPDPREIGKSAREPDGDSSE